MGSETLYGFTRRLVRDSERLQKRLTILATLIAAFLAMQMLTSILQGKMHSMNVLVDALQTLILLLMLLLTIPQLIVTPYTEYLKVLEERRRRHWARLRRAIVLPLARLVLDGREFKEVFKTGCYIPACSMLRLLVVDRGFRAYYEDLGRHEVTRGLYCVLEALCGPPKAVCYAGLEAKVEDLVEEALREAGVDPVKPPGPAVEEAVRCAVYTAASMAAAYAKEEAWLVELKRRITMELANPVPSCAEGGAIGSPLLPRDKAKEVAEKVAEKLSEAKIYERLRKLYGKLREELNKTLLYETLTDDCPYINPESKKQEEPPKCPEVEDP